MVSEGGATRGAQPATLADLNLPPTFVVDHGIRTFFHQGPLTPQDLARHWHIDAGIAIEVIDMLKAAGLLQADAAQASFERRGRVHLSAGGLERVEIARQRTWYAGPLPVSLHDFSTHLAPSPPLAKREDLRASLGAMQIDVALADAIGQAMAGAATLQLAGLAEDEQAAVASALAGSIVGEVTLPFAVFAAGAVVRTFDARYHRPLPADLRETEAADLLRPRDTFGQWTHVAAPCIALSGGVLASDVLPAFDTEAKFYVAPTPLLAVGGMLAVLDAGANPQGLGDLARLWLIPGRYGAAVLLLRSGERIEVPWRASTVLFSTTQGALTPAMRALPVYAVDVAPLEGERLRSFLAARFAGAGISGGSEATAGLLEQFGLATRVAAARTAMYLRDRARYEGAAFDLTAAVLQGAIEFAGKPAARAGGALRAA